MSMRRLSLSAIALGFVAFACSYAPRPEDGKQECYGPDRQCPDGYTCQGDGKCWSDGHAPALPPPGAGGQQSATGGKPSSGGAPGSGGSKSTGGALGLGGVIGTGGAVGHGGVVVSAGGASGGTTSVGGISGTGGASTPPNTGTVMTISSYQARGAMTGFGWIALGELDTVSDPPCLSPATPIVSGLACNHTGWSTPDAYCMTGYIPEVSSDGNWEQNWGIEIGINATPNPGGTLGQSFSGIAISVTGTPSTNLRAVVHRKGDPDGTTYCASFTAGTPVAFASFNSTCWNNEGKYLAASDVANLDQVGVQVSSGTEAITIENLCITGISFTK